MTINENDGLLEFNKFVEEPEPFCRGIKNIESYLSTKNNDKNIKNISEAFIIIKGKLKIFDYIKLEQELIDKIEFVDLPGYDRKKNEFNEKKYYHKILKFSNSCIYINIANNIQTSDSYDRMKVQYDGDKQNIFVTLQPKFIDTCLFLVNKSDELPKQKDKDQAKNNLIDIVSKIEPLAKENKNRINISFFSGKYFFEYLENYERYVTNMETNPIITLIYLYNQWSSNKYYIFGFKKFITNKICDKIEDDYDEIGENPTPQWYYQNLKNAFNILYSHIYRDISNKEEDEIINKLYNIYELFKNKDISSTKYSCQFFYDLKKVIINAENLQKENFTKNFEAFFQASDELFKKEIKNEQEASKKKAESLYNLFSKELIPLAQKELTKKEEIIKNIINSGKQKCFDRIKREIDNIERVLDEFKYDIEKAYSRFENELSEIIKKMQKEQEEVANNIIEDLKKKIEEKIKAYYQAQNIPPGEKNIIIEQTISFFAKILALSINTASYIIGVSLGIGALIGVGLGATASSLLGATFIAAIGITGGLILGGIIVGIGYLFVRYKKRNNYLEILEKVKTNLQNKFNEVEYSFSDHYRTFKDTLIKELKVKNEIYFKRINNDETEWKEIQKQYEIIKKNTLKKVNEKYNFN